MVDLYKKKAELVYQANDLKNKAAEEDRQLTPEELTQFEKYFADAEQLQKQIDAETRLTQMEATMNVDVYGSKGRAKAGDLNFRYDDVFNKWMRVGYKGLTEEERGVLNFDQSGNVKLFATKEEREMLKDIVEKRTSAIANPTYVAPISLYETFNATQKAIGPWMDACTTIRTDTGEIMYVPYTNDAGNDGSLEAEGTDAIASSTDVTLARTQLDAYWYSSTGLTVGWSTLRDASYPVTEFIVQPLMNRLMRAISTAGTTGTGSSQPYGIVTSSVLGENATKSVAPDADDMNALLKSVDYSYHNNPGSGFMFTSGTMFGLAAQVKSATYNTEPLWQPSLAAGIPSTLYGYKYWINNSMDTYGSNKKCMLFGDFGYCILRYAGPLIISRLEERYAEKGQVGFLISQYFDSDIKAIGTTYHPYKHIRNVGT